MFALEKSRVKQCSNFVALIVLIPQNPTYDVGSSLIRVPFFGSQYSTAPLIRELPL